MSSFANVLTREIEIDKGALRLAGILIMTLLLALGAYVRLPLPFSPVPVTLQTFFVIFGSMVLGRYAVSACLAYMLMGAAGLPVFQGYNSGLLYLMGPTGGYLAGFILASYAAGRLSESGANVILSILVAKALIYIPGVLWLSFILKSSLTQAVILGFIPFLPGAFIKGSAAYLLYKKTGTKIQTLLK